jgi:4-hydroxy-tetrahydrodipicolinate reductase
MLRIAVAGAAGRMGIRIMHIIQASDQAELSAAFEYSGSPAVGRPVSQVAGLAGPDIAVGDDAEAAFANSDVMIDFTSPKASLANLDAAVKADKPLVIGTTGFEPDQKERVAKEALKVPVLMTPNMSVGMNLMFKLAHDMAKVLGEDYALELMEAHHDQKKDAPSGSAIRLLEGLARARGWNPDEVCKHGRQGLTGARTKNEIGVSVIRGGDITGEHTVYFIAQGERLELTHRAHTRDTFAKGAVRAAIWLAGQKPGLYDMWDVLGLQSDIGSHI